MSSTKTTKNAAVPTTTTSNNSNDTRTYAAKMLDSKRDIWFMTTTLPEKSISFWQFLVSDHMLDLVKKGWNYKKPPIAPPPELPPHPDMTSQPSTTAIYRNVSSFSFEVVSSCGRPLIQGCCQQSTDDVAHLIDFALQLSVDGKIFVKEFGVIVTSVGTFVEKDRLSIKVVGKEVHYFKNDTNIYISKVAPVIPLKTEVTGFCSIGQITNVSYEDYVAPEVVIESRKQKFWQKMLFKGEKQLRYEERVMIYKKALVDSGVITHGVWCPSDEKFCVRNTGANVEDVPLCIDIPLTDLHSTWKKNPNIDAALQYWWKHMPKNSIGLVTENYYKQMVSKLFKKMFPDSSKAEIIQAAHDDWAFDVTFISGSSQAMDISSFERVMYTWLDIWCETAEPHECESFLKYCHAQVFDDKGFLSEEEALNRSPKSSKPSTKSAKSLNTSSTNRKVTTSSSSSSSTSTPLLQNSSNSRPTTSNSSTSSPNNKTGSSTVANNALPQITKRPVRRTSKLIRSASPLKSSALGVMDQLPKSKQIPSNFRMDVTGLAITDAQLSAVFREIDADHSGFITRDEFHLLFSHIDSMGLDVPQSQIEKLMDDNHLMDDEMLSYDEFCLLMLKIAQW